MENSRKSPEEKGSQLLTRAPSRKDAIKFFTFTFNHFISAK